MMSIALITQPAILRTHFAYTRQGLLGTWKRSVRVQTSPEVTLSPDQSVSPVSFQAAELVPQAVEWTPQVVESAFQPLPELPEQWSAVSVAHSQPIQPIAWWKPMARFVLSMIIVASLVVAGIIVVPEVYSRVFSQTGSVAQVADVAKGSAPEVPAQTEKAQPYLPPQNPELPEGTWLSIPSIGVYSELLPTLNPDEALNKGVWMVPDFGRPGDYSQPTIVAAHRYGWDWWWQTDYWKYNSFYLLTETQPGDRIEVIHDKRKWVYEIYAAEEGELISDYSANLILYTCKYLNSPIRHFRYANVVIPK